MRPNTGSPEPGPRPHESSTPSRTAEDSNPWLPRELGTKYPPSPDCVEKVELRVRLIAIEDRRDLSVRGRRQNAAGDEINFPSLHQGSGIRGRVNRLWDRIGNRPRGRVASLGDHANIQASLDGSQEISRRGDELDYQRYSQRSWALGRE